MMAIIEQIKEKSKLFYTNFLNFFKRDVVFYTLLIIFSSSISFFLGSLSEFQKQKVEKKDSIQLINQKFAKEVYYVASKNGKKYYLPWCYSGSEENKVKFKSVEDAKKAGYTPSKNCEGL